MNISRQYRLLVKLVVGFLEASQIKDLAAAEFEFQGDTRVDLEILLIVLPVPIDVAEPTSPGSARKARLFRCQRLRLLSWPIEESLA